MIKIVQNSLIYAPPLTHRTLIVHRKGTSLSMPCTMMFPQNINLLLCATLVVNHELFLVATLQQSLLENLNRAF